MGRTITKAVLSATAFCIVLVLLMGCATTAPPAASPHPPPQPVVVVDTGFQLNAGQIQATQPLSAGDYEFEVTSDDGLTIVTYTSVKDVEIVKANGQGAEYYRECSATKNIRFHQTCTLKDGAVFTMRNPNLFQKINVNVKITKLR